MTTKELIEKLKKIDPNGTLDVVLDGCYDGCEVSRVVKHEIRDFLTDEVLVYYIQLC